MVEQGTEECCRFGMRDYFMAMLISVIIPVYNVAQFLKEAIESAINQTYRNLEIIIIDDGSTDGSSNICDYYTYDSRVKVIHQKNKGLSGARNTGLELMTGDYVSFLDSDDVFRQDMLEKMIEGFKNHDCDLVACGYENIITNQELSLPGQRIKSSFYYEKEEMLSSEEARRRVLNGQIRINVWSKVYKKEIWDTIRFPEGHVYEDNHVIFQVLEKCKKVLTIPKPYILHREWNGSIIANQSLKNLKDKILAERVMAEYIESHSPEIFPDRLFTTFFEGQAVNLSVHYAVYRYQKKTHEMIELFRTEAINRWKVLEGKSKKVKIRIVRFLFFHFPSMLVPIKSIWSLKNVMRKIKWTKRRAF